MPTLHRVGIFVSMNDDEYYKIGYVAQTHGLKGSVSVVMSPECPDLKTVSSLFIQVNSQFVPHFIESVSVKGNKAFVKLEDVNSPEEAASLKGCSLFLLKKERPKLARGEFYSDELLGFEVVDMGSGVLGNVKSILESGPSRHLVLFYNQKEVLIPINGPFIQGVNKAKKKITVELPAGFLEI